MLRAASPRYGLEGYGLRAASPRYGLEGYGLWVRGAYGALRVMGYGLRAPTARYGLEGYGLHPLNSAVAGRSSFGMTGGLFKIVGE